MLSWSSLRVPIAWTLISTSCRFSERFLERTKVRLITAPFLRRLSVDRSPHLLGAGGANGPFRLVELEYLRLEPKLAIVEEPPHLGFCILDHPFIDHAVHAPRKHNVHMGHEPDIVGIIAADMIKIIRERLASSEMLAEIGQAATERVPPRFDDLGVR